MLNMKLTLKDGSVNVDPNNPHDMKGNPIPDPRS